MSAQDIDLLGEKRNKAMLAILLASGLAGAGVAAGRELFSGFDEDESEITQVPDRVRIIARPPLTAKEDKKRQRTGTRGEYKFSSDRLLEKEAVGRGALLGMLLGGTLGAGGGLGGRELLLRDLGSRATATATEKAIADSQSLFESPKTLDDVQGVLKKYLGNMKDYNKSWPSRLQTDAMRSQGERLKRVVEKRLSEYSELASIAPRAAGLKERERRMAEPGLENKVMGALTSAIGSPLVGAAAGAGIGGGIGAGYDWLTDDAEKAAADAGDGSIWDKDVYTLPMALAAALGGGAAGYGGVNYLAKKYRDWRTQRELEGARAEYDELLKERYGLARSTKLAAEIDNAFNQYMGEHEKQALTSSEMASIAGGGYLTLGGLLWALSHMAAKRKMEEADPELQRRKAIEKRLRLQRTAKPPSFTFEMPAPALSAAEEDEEPDLPNKPGLGKASGLMSDAYNSAQSGVSGAIKGITSGVSGTIDSISSGIEGMAADNMSPEKKQDFLTTAQSAGQEAAGDKNTGNAITAGLTDNRAAAVAGASEAVGDKMQGSLGGSPLSFLLR